MDQQVPGAAEVLLVKQELLVPQVSLDLKGVRVVQVPREVLEPGEKQEPEGNQELPVQQAAQGRGENRDHLDKEDSQVLQDPQDLQDLLVNVGAGVSQDNVVNQEHQAVKVCGLDQKGR